MIKHYFRAVILLLLVIVGFIALPVGLLIKIMGIGKPFGDYLTWLVRLSERWTFELYTHLDKQKE